MIHTSWYAGFEMSPHHLIDRAIAIATLLPGANMKPHVTFAEEELKLCLHENVSIVNAYFNPKMLSIGGHRLQCLHINVSTRFIY